jgi:uncharacterized protein (DUF1778 family)
MCAHGGGSRTPRTSEVTAVSALSPKAERLQVRVSGEEKTLLERAAAASKQSSSEFIRGAALHHAEHVLADRRHFTLDADQWEQFEAALDREPTGKDKLRELLQSPSILDAD